MRTAVLCPLAVAVSLMLVFLGASRAAGEAPVPQGPPAGQDTPRPTYTNPISNVRIADPFVLKHDGVYYLVGTAGRNGFLCWTSRDLVDWSPAGYALKATDESWGKRTFWAPEIFEYRGRFYMAYSAMHERGHGYRICLAVSDTPAGPYTDLRAPWFDIDWSTIDADPFIDQDGTPYLFFTRVGVVRKDPEHPENKLITGATYGVRLRDDLSGLDGEPVLCVQAEQPWELVDKDRTLCNEGPFVFRHGDRYYMTYSSGNYARPAYGIGYATAPSPLGPWTKSTSNPLVQTDLSIGVSGPGHSSNTTSPDGSELFLVYHSHRDPQTPAPTASSTSTACTSGRTAA